MSKFTTVQSEEDWKSMASLEEVPGESLISLKTIWQQGLYLNKPQNIWNKILIDTLPKWRSWPSSEKAKHWVSHGGRGMMIWAYYHRVDHELLCIQNILESDIRAPIWKLKLGWDWVMQKDDDPNHSWKSHLCVFQWPKVQTWIQLKCCGGSLRNDNFKLLLVKVIL